MAPRRDRAALSMPAEGLARRAIRGALWVTALNATTRGLGLARIVILAHLLTPREFGLAGVALVVLSFFDAMRTTGTQLALIQRRRDATEMFDTAWTANLVRDSLVALSIVVFAPLVGRVLALPDVVPVLQAMALVPLLRGFTNIAVVEFRRELTFRPYSLMQVTGTLADLCIALPLALWLRNVWALVAGLVALTAARLVMSYVLHPYRPRLRLDRAQFLELYRYGRWVSLSNMAEWVLSGGVQGAIVRLLDVHALGVYQVAWRIAALPIAQIGAPLDAVTLSAYARLQESRDRARAAYLRVLSLTALVAWPLVIAVTLHAEDIVRLLLGVQWLDAVPLIRVFGLFGWARSVGATSRPLFNGLGRPAFHALLAAVELGVVAALLWPLAQRLGVLGPAMAVTGGALVAAAGVVIFLKHWLAIAVGPLARTVAPPAVACVPWIVLRLSWVGSADTILVLLGEAVLFAVLFVSGLLAMDRLALYRVDPAIREMLGRWIPRRR